MDNKAVVEALLFVAAEPLPPDRMADVTGLSAKEIRNTLNQLREEYSFSGRGLQLLEVAGCFQMATKPELAPVLEKLFQGEHRFTLSQAALETLAVISYRQPVTRVDIEAIRGVKVDGVIETLLKRRFIRMVGRKDAPGRPMLYGTTRDFLKYFGLKDLSELPLPPEREQEVIEENKAE
jgi:segregation and condensation protein B